MRSAPEACSKARLGDDRERAGIERDEPVFDAQCLRASVEILEHAQRRILDVRDATHVEPQDPRSVLLDQRCDLSEGAIRIQEENAPLGWRRSRPSIVSSSGCSAARDVRAALATDQVHSRMSRLNGQADHRQNDRDQDPLQSAQREHAETCSHRRRNSMVRTLRMAMNSCG